MLGFPRFPTLLGWAAEATVAISTVTMASTNDLVIRSYGGAAGIRFLIGGGAPHFGDDRGPHRARKRRRCLCGRQTLSEDTSRWCPALPRGRLHREGSTVP